MTGKIVKAVGGFYYVHVPGMGVYECRARGIVRKGRDKPLIGDSVEMVVTDEDGRVGHVESILERKNHLERPTVANLDQAVIVFSVSHPAPNYNLLDRFLVMVEAQSIDAIICFNKIDLVPAAQISPMVKMYEEVGYPVVVTSSSKAIGIRDLKTQLYGKTSVFAGPSGVGKSSILNLIQDQMVLETGAISQKVGRGKHTTRHVELICFHDDSYVVDTPGFSSLEISANEAGRVKHYFREFDDYEPYCKFTGCNHLNEPKCGIRNAVEKGDINISRYNSYVQFMGELGFVRNK